MREIETLEVYQVIELKLILARVVEGSDLLVTENEGLHLVEIVAVGSIEDHLLGESPALIFVLLVVEGVLSLLLELLDVVFQLPLQLLEEVQLLFDSGFVCFGCGGCCLGPHKLRSSAWLLVVEHFLQQLFLVVAAVGSNGPWVGGESFLLSCFDENRRFLLLGTLNFFLNLLLRFINCLYLSFNSLGFFFYFFLWRYFIFFFLCNLLYLLIELFLGMTPFHVLLEKRVRTKLPATV